MRCSNSKRKNFNFCKRIKQKIKLIYCKYFGIFLTIWDVETLPGPAAINAAFQLNSIVIIGMGVGVGFQIFLSEKSKLLGCKLNVKKKTFGGNSGGATATSFFSFFSLVPLGCCGWWLYALSLLPSVVGTGVSAILIEHSQTLAYLGLTIIFSFNGLTAYKLRKERRAQRAEAIK